MSLESAITQRPGRKLLCGFTTARPAEYAPGGDAEKDKSAGLGNRANAGHSTAGHAGPPVMP